MNESVEEIQNQSLRSHLAQGLASPQVSWDYKNFNAALWKKSEKPRSLTPPHPWAVLNLDSQAPWMNRLGEINTLGSRVQLEFRLLTHVQKQKAQFRQK